MERSNVFRSSRHALLLCAFLPAAFGQEANRLEREALQQWSEGRAAEAISTYRKAIPLFSGPAQARVLNLIGEMERLTGQAAAAELLHRRALALDPRAAHANNLAEDLRTLGRFEEADKFYSQAVASAAASGASNPEV